MEEDGGNVIASYRMRMVESTDEHVVMSMPYQPAARQGTGVFCSGILIQLADVAATSVCFNHMVKTARRPGRTCRSRWPSRSAPTSSATPTAATIIAESRLVHGGRTMMVCESTVRDEDGRLLATVTTTHLIPPRR